MMGNTEIHNSEQSNLNFVVNDKKSLFNEKGGLPIFLAEELVENVFGEINNRNKCHIKISSSKCQSFQQKSQTYGDNDDMDPRLKCWNNMLRDRKVLQQRIERRTGKRAEDVLFNRHATIDVQAKQMIIRLLDTAERSKGVPPNRVKGVLRMRHNAELCREVRELHPTEPKLERLAFVGLPEVTQLELANTVQTGETKWLRSEVLSERLEQQEENILSVMSHYPELDQLQITTLIKSPAVPVIDTQCLGDDLILCVSETTEEAKEDAPQSPKPMPPVEKFEKKTRWEENNVILINGISYGFGSNSDVLSGDLHLLLQCDPLQRIRKTIVQLDNIGNKFIQIRWHQMSLLNKELHQHTPIRSEFVFDSQPFVLLPGNQRRIDVLYQPSRVGVKKQHWCLVMQRSPFCGVRRLHIRFHGVCTQPVIYRDRLDLDQRLVINKRNRQINERLTQMHAELAPMVERSTLSCPYQRVLDERELFSVQNPGFKCDRYADLETLKELYVLVKKPRQPPWDYRLETLRQCIYQHDAEHRESLQNIVVELLSTMRGNSNEVFPKEKVDMQRERSCFLYVRGIVGSTIDEWENISDGLGEKFFKSELRRYRNELKEKSKKLPYDKDYVKSLVFKRVLSCKYFKDSLYIHTYSLVCDAAENIVSAIESALTH
ncbi:uncharacterized protein LOC6560037 [Drosophila grimshawi]|nr:uncharacterized protein LOC6560037 [Drosophila grimshawi]